VFSYIKKNSHLQKILIASWEHPNNPHIIMPFIWECDNCLKLIEKINKLFNLELFLAQLL